MSPKLGSHYKENPKTVTMNLRLTKEEAENISYCAEKLNTSKTAAINTAVNKLKEELELQN